MITKKLLQFQKLNISVTKDADNPFFKSKYVPLNEVLAKVKKPLNDLGVVIIQTPGVGLSGHTGLFTKLVDTEDESSVDCFMPYVEATTAQKLGSNNTYNRRYSLVTLLGLEDVDDDGNAASTVAKIQSGQPFTADEYEEATDVLPDEAFGAVRQANKDYRATNPAVKRNPGIQYGKKATGDRLKQVLNNNEL